MRAKVLTIQEIAGTAGALARNEREARKASLQKTARLTARLRAGAPALPAIS